MMNRCDRLEMRTASERGRGVADLSSWGSWSAKIDPLAASQRTKTEGGRGGKRVKRREPQRRRRRILQENRTLSDWRLASE